MKLLTDGGKLVMGWDLAKSAVSSSPRTPCWPPVGQLDCETDQLVYLVEAGWAWQWPGWKWVAATLNSEYGNNRTPQACRAKYDRIMREANATHDGRRIRRTVDGIVGDSE